mmetsp:Transcript_62686/g.123945  ORF Transcript_62686/g.123945 Transcript_62686/m.123945 type:complete len:161 (-) Transcript_62686:323-805(-)
MELELLSRLLSTLVVAQCLLLASFGLRILLASLSVSGLIFVYACCLDRLRNVRQRRRRQDAKCSVGVVKSMTSVQEPCFHSDSGLCAICLETIADPSEAMLAWESDLVRLPCNHAFHADCLSQWFEVDATCPLCRSLCGINVKVPLPGAEAAQQLLPEGI